LSNIKQAVPVNTFPGANHVLAPPKGWTGSGAEYRILIRERWKTDYKMRVGIAFTARIFIRFDHDFSDIEGPYAAEALEIMRGVVGHTRPVADA
jgi:hypothetical protein